MEQTGQIRMLEAPLGIVVVSQTCDNVRADWIQVVPVVRLEDGRQSQARRGNMPRYAHLPAMGDDYFAELDKVATISKSLLRQADLAHGVTELADGRKLAQALGRRYSRFAFPDRLVEWLQPLRGVAQSKAGKATSAEGQALGRINQIRVRSEDGWLSEPFRLGFTLILEAGDLPFDVIEDEDQVADLNAWLIGKTAAEIASRLAQDEPHEQARLMLALGEKWFSKCSEDGPAGVVADYSVDLASADEYSLASYFVSEALDFDHLSPPPLSA